MSYYDTQTYKQLKPFFAEADFLYSCAFGLPFVAQRNTMKAWCGYVGVPSTHPHYGKDYGELIAIDPDTVLIEKQSPIALLLGALKSTEGGVAIDLVYNVHGGITWSRDYAPPSFSPPGYWWFGFDCSHYNDLSPQDIIQSEVEDQWWREGEYRDIKYVENECRRLAEQLTDFSCNY